MNMKRIVLAAAVMAAMISAPASASIAPATPVAAAPTSSHGVPFCQKYPDVCAAVCAAEPWRLMCHTA